MPRPYHCFGYPLVPAVFLMLPNLVVVNAFVATPRQALLGAGLIVLGLPVYLYYTRRRDVAAA